MAGDPSVERGLWGARALSAGLGSPLQTACRARLGSAAGQFPRTRRPEGGQWGQDPPEAPGSCGGGVSEGRLPGACWGHT